MADKEDSVKLKPHEMSPSLMLGLRPPFATPKRALTSKTTSPASNCTGTYNYAATGLQPIDIVRRNLRFEMGDFHISRRFKSFIQSLVVPDGLIHSRLERIAECVLRDFGSECREISLIVTQDNSVKFYRDLQKKL